MLGIVDFGDDQNTLTGFRDVLQSYEMLWEAGGRPELSKFLESLPVELRQDLALDLLRIDFRERKKLGERPRLEDYQDLPVEISSVLEDIGAELSSRDPYASPTESNALGEVFAEPATLKPGDQIGRYQLESLIGKGGFGTVWRAFDPQLKRKVAIKIPKTISAEANRNILAEAQKAAALDHPHIVAVYDVGQHDRYGYIVSRLLTGGNLKEFLAKHRLDVEEGVRLVLQIVEALDFAHRQGIHHRDMKPGNVLRSAEGELLITDFGLAKSETAEFSVVSASRIAGTPAYMPQEQLLGGPLLSEAAVDIYAAGVILYEVLCRQRPRRGTTYQELVVETLAGKQVSAPRSLHPDIPAAVEEVCLKAIESDPSKRYQTAAHMAADLRRCLTPASSVAQTQVVVRDQSTEVESGRLSDTPLLLHSEETTIIPEQPPRPKTRWPLWLGGAAALVVLAALGAGTLLRSPDGLVPIEIDVNPPEAVLTFIPLTSDTGIPRPQNAVTVTSKTTTKSVRLAPGIYLVEAVVSESQFHEVYRTIPAPDASGPRAPFGHSRWRRNAQGIVELPDIRVPVESTDGLVEISAIGAHVISGTNPPQTFQVSAFSITRDLIRYPMWKSSRLALPRLESRMKSNEALNAGVELGQIPLVYVSWDEALSLAESQGLRLPDENELEAAHQSGLLQEGVSEYSEWVSNWATSQVPLGKERQFMPASPLHRVARGPFAFGEPVPRQFLDCRDVYENVAMRFARSGKPRLSIEDFPKISE